MRSHPDDVFENEDDRHPTPKISREAEISESSGRAHAADIGVPRVGPSYAWRKRDYEELLTRLREDEDDEDDEDDEESDCTDDDCTCTGHDGESDCEDDECECADHEEEDDDA